MSLPVHFAPRISQSQRFGDYLIVGSTAAFSLSEALVGGRPVSNWLWFGGLVIVESLVLFWRRQQPAAVFGATVAVAAFSDMIGYATAANAVVVAVYAAARFGSRRVAWSVGLAAIGLHLGDMSLSQDRSDLWLGFAILSLAWLLGDRLRLQALRQMAMSEKLERLELERDQRARDAVQRERMRIARELHDIVSHSLSAMVMHAGGARNAPVDTPAPVLAALKTIEETGRRELGEIRQLLGVLRDNDDDDDGGVLGPAPNLDQLEELVVDGSLQGVEIALRVEAPGLSPAMQLTVYRIVQESLSNVRRHSSTDRVEIDVRVQDSELLVQVQDNGRRHSVGPTQDSSEACEDEVGYGLVGMGERVGLYGGRLLAGWATTGYRVQATIPVPFDHG